MAIAIGIVHMGTIKGKLNGTMDVTIPSGARRSEQDTCEETWSVLPCANCGREHAYSTVSFPFATSANALYNKYCRNNEKQKKNQYI